MRILLVWRSFAKSMKQARQTSSRLHSLRRHFRARMTLLRWYSVAVKQPRIMLGAYKRLQRRGHHSLSVISAQYGAYAHYWLRVLLLSWKRLVFDAPGGFLLHRETRLRRQQNFGNALATSTKLLSRAYEVEDKETQCALRSREETVFKEKIEELSAAREQEGELRALREGELRRELEQLKSDYKALEKSLKKEQNKVAETSKQLQRQQSLNSVKTFATSQAASEASEAKAMREQTLSFPVTYDRPVIATINNIHEIELRNVQNTQKLLRPISHRISSCRLDGESLLAVYENDSVLITFHSDGVANLCVVAGLLSKYIKRNREDFGTNGISLNICHRASQEAHVQVDHMPLDEIRAANHKVELLLKDSQEEKLTIEELMRDEKENAPMLAGPSHADVHKEPEVKPISLDQQLREAQMKKETKPVSLDQQLREAQMKKETKPVSLDQQLREASVERKDSKRMSLDQQLLLLSMEAEGNKKPKGDSNLFGRLSMQHRKSEANVGLIEEL